MSITVYDNREEPDPGLLPAEFSQCLEKVASVLKLPPGDIEISLVDDPHMQDLNRQFRKIDKPTNVLAFPLFNWNEPLVPSNNLPVSGPDDPPCVLGDIVISTSTIQREAIEFQTTFTEQLMRMTIHGMLHLVGYEHETEEEADIMDDQTEIGLQVYHDYRFSA